LRLRANILVTCATDRISLTQIWPLVSFLLGTGESLKPEKRISESAKHTMAGL
jgi:hypothetical protein